MYPGVGSVGAVLSGIQRVFCEFRHPAGYFGHLSSVLVRRPVVLAECSLVLLADCVEA